MNIERIDDPIGVVARFSAGSLQPVRFRWAGREYDIDTVNGQWTDRSSDHYALCYSVQVGEETFYLRFASGEVQWWLEQVIVP